MSSSSGRSKFWWTCVAVAGASVAALVMAQRKLMYIPMSSGYPKPHGLPIRDVFYHTNDGVKIHGWFLEGQNSDTQNTKLPGLLFFHGNAGDVNGRAPLLQYFHNYIGCPVFIIDYRGFGLSENASQSEEGFIQDGVAALHHMRNELGVEDVILYGRSLGGAVAMGVFEREHENIKALIVENTFTSMTDMAKTVLPIFKPLFYIPGLIFDTWNSKKRIQNLPHDSHIHFISALKDELVPPAQMKELFDVCPTVKFWNEISNRGHDDTWAERKMLYIFRKIIDQHSVVKEFSKWGNSKDKE